jgi:glycerophosphoryl diester phosphodiesterase
LKRPEAADLGWLIARPIAHRGYHDSVSGRIENTLPAFEAAVSRGFGLECDVRGTADGQVVVFHDERLERLTEASGLVAQRSLRDLRAARFRSGDARIPTLDELLDLVDGRVPLLVELKAESGDEGVFAGTVAATLARYAGPVAAMSFEPATMIAIRRAAPQLPRGMLAEAFRRRDYSGLSALGRFARRHLLAAPLVLPQFVACDIAHLPAAAPLLIRHFVDLPLLAWTIRSRDDALAGRQWVDQIIFEGFDPDA